MTGTVEGLVPAAGSAMARPAHLTGQDWATIAIALTLATLPAVMPVMVAALATSFHLDIEQSGYVVSANMGGIMVGALLGNLLGRHVGRRLLLFAGIGVMIAGNVLTVVQNDYSLLVGLRAMSGLGEGVAVAAAYVLMGFAAQPERVIGFYAAGQGLVGAIGMGLLTPLVATHGATIFYAIVSVAALPGLLLVPYATRGRSEPVAAKRAGGVRLSRGACRGLATILAYFGGMALIWAFLERIATAHGLSVGSTALALSASAVAGIVGPAIVALFAHRLSNRTAMLLGGALLLLCGAGLGASNDLVFGSAICLVSFTWNFAFPFLFRSLAQAEGGAEASGLVPVATAAALTIGPAFGGIILQRAGIAILILAFLAITIAALVAAGTVRPHRSAAA